MIIINVIKPFITVFVTIYNFLHFSEYATQDRILRHDRVIYMYIL